MNKKIRLLVWLLLVLALVAGASVALTKTQQISVGTPVSFPVDI